MLKELSEVHPFGAGLGFVPCNILYTKSKAKVKRCFKVKAIEIASTSSTGIKTRLDNSLAH